MVGLGSSDPGVSLRMRFLAPPCGTSLIPRLLHNALLETAWVLHTQERKDRLSTWHLDMLLLLFGTKRKDYTWVL